LPGKWWLYRVSVAPDGDFGKITYNHRRNADTPGVLGGGGQNGQIHSGKYWQKPGWLNCRAEYLYDPPVN